MFQVSLAKIVSETNDLELIGSDRMVSGFSSIVNADHYSIVWIKNYSFLHQLKNRNAVVLTEDCNVADELRDQTSVLLVKSNSRFIVAQIHTAFFRKQISFGKNCADEWRENGFEIGDFTFIGPNVQLGEGTIVGPNVSLIDKVVISNNCIIQSNTVIGIKGLGLEWSGSQYLEFPQLGSVIIGAYSEIGPLSSIRKGALIDTTIGSHVMIGSLCNIGHNVTIGNATILTSSVCVSGSVFIGTRVFLGVGSTIKNKVSIGDRATVGQGCVVVKDVAPDRTVVGNPARVM
jgi:UDP-3-O-[3-hydroxymyristoyl] glucosamine N-acyltransferase